MKVVLLGTAAGGGFPQWNCGCHLCSLVRAGFPGVAPRTQDCVAVTGDGEHWYLLNASPDIRAQITGCTALSPGPGRWTPVRGVLLTDAELDHTLGLLALREAIVLRVWAPETVLGALRKDFPMRGMLDRYHGADWQQVEPGAEFIVDDHLAVTAVPLSTKLPKYASPTAGTWVVGYRIEDLNTGGVLLYAPCLAEWPPHLDDVLAGADCALLDGTFWSAGEMSSATGVGAQERMGHLPISGPGGSLERLAAHSGVRRVYTHLNNTNPLLDITTPERAELVAAGVEVLHDGAELNL